MEKTLFFVVIGLVAIAVNACPKHQYYYQVVELPLPAIRDLGKFILNEMKQQREVQTDTCKDENSKYIQAVASDKDSFDSKKMTEIYMHQREYNPREIFEGIRHTENALRSFCTLNLLMTKDMAVRRFLLQHGTDGDVFEEFSTEEALMTKISRNPAWRDVNVVQCTHYLYHIATTYANRNISITLVDKDNGGEELLFFHSVDVGGFWKQGCNERYAANFHGADEECEEPFPLLD